jgi:hypothetical protein
LNNIEPGSKLFKIEKPVLSVSRFPEKFVFALVSKHFLRGVEFLYWRIALTSITYTILQEEEEEAEEEGDEGGAGDDDDPICID